MALANEHLSKGKFVDDVRQVGPEFANVAQEYIYTPTGPCLAYRVPVIRGSIYRDGSVTGERGGAAPRVPGLGGMDQSVDALREPISGQRRRIRIRRRVDSQQS